LSELGMTIMLLLNVFVHRKHNKNKLSTRVPGTQKLISGKCYLHVSNKNVKPHWYPFAITVTK